VPYSTKKLEWVGNNIFVVSVPILAEWEKN
jgi:hypothetical protein